MSHPFTVGACEIIGIFRQAKLVKKVSDTVLNHVLRQSIEVGKACEDLAACQAFLNGCRLSQYARLPAQDGALGDGIKAQDAHMARSGCQDPIE